MTCSCEFSGWLMRWLSSFGTAGAFVALGLVLMFWGSRKVRREHFNVETWGRALLLNWPAFMFMGLGMFVILSTLAANLFRGIMT